MRRHITGTRLSPLRQPGRACWYWGEGVRSEPTGDAKAGHRTTAHSVSRTASNSRPQRLLVTVRSSRCPPTLLWTRAHHLPFYAYTICCPPRPRVKEHCIQKGLPWATSLACTVASQQEYYEELVRQYKAWLRVRCRTAPDRPRVGQGGKCGREGWGPLGGPHPAVSVPKSTLVPEGQ